jgi:hypothetical protein
VSARKTMKEPISKTFEQRMAEARARVNELDKVDGHKDRDLKTIWAALDAGLRHPECGAQYDALVMLEDLTGRRQCR